MGLAENIIQVSGCIAGSLASSVVDWWIAYDGVRLTSQNCGLYVPIVHTRVIVMWTMV
jgi:hypothetical protein